MVKLQAPFGVTNARIRHIIKDFRGVIVCECDDADKAYMLVRILNLLEEKEYAPSETRADNSA